MLVGNLPPEVCKRIVDYLVAFGKEGRYGSQMAEGRKALSRLSRVCRELAYYLRPLLFEDLRLRDSSDTSFLRSIIYSTTSAMLTPHILTIRLLNYRGSILILVSLFSHLPSLQKLRIRLDEPSKLPFELRPQLSRLYSLRYLSLDRITFPSLSTFLRLIGAILPLEELVLTRVTWTSVSEPNQFPDCKAGFCNIKMVTCVVRNSSPCWPISWISAAVATGYTYRRSGVVARDPNIEIPPPDINILVRVMKLVLTYLDKLYLEFILSESTEDGNVT
jgi:hypothetical protein